MTRHSLISLLLLIPRLVPPAVILIARFTRDAPPASRWARVGTLQTRVAGAAADVVSRAPTGPRRVRPDRIGEERIRLLGLPRQRLYDLARTRGVAGRSRMTREQLVEAVLAASAKRPT
jgi:hypothetical protein